MTVSGDRERYTWVDSADPAHIDGAAGPVLTAEDVGARGDSGRAEATPARRERHHASAVVERLVPDDDSGTRRRPSRRPRGDLLRRVAGDANQREAAAGHNA